MRKLLAFTLLIAACGSADHPPTTTPEQTTDVEAPPEPEPLVAEDEEPAVVAGGAPTGGGTTSAGPPRLAAIIIDTQVQTSDVEIIFDAGNTQGVQTGWHGEIVGLAGSSFTVTSCKPKTCKATLTSFSLDQVNRSSKEVEVWP